MRVNNYDPKTDSYEFDFSSLLIALVERNKTYDQVLTGFFDEDATEFERQLSKAEWSHDSCRIMLDEDQIGSLGTMVFNMTNTLPPPRLCSEKIRT